MLTPNQAYYATFTTQNTGGAATNADSTPTATLRRNGTTDAAVVLTVTNLSTGQYKITGTVPNTYTVGDLCQVEVSATVAGLAGKATIDSFVVDTARSSDIYNRIGAGGAALTALGDTRLARLDATISSRAASADLQQGLTTDQAEQLDFIYGKFDQTAEGPVALVPAPPAGPIPLVTIAFDATAFGIAQPGVTIAYEMVEAKPVKIADRFQIPRAVQATTDEDGRALVYLYPSSELAAGNYATTYRVNCPEAKINALITVPDEGALLADLL